MDILLLINIILFRKKMCIFIYTYKANELIHLFIYCVLNFWSNDDDDDNVVGQCMRYLYEIFSSHLMQPEK